MAESLLWVTISDVERFSREQDTRDSVHGPFLKNYLRSLENTHGWNDGDAFYTSYILHPMQGSLTNYIERQNDPKFRTVEFGKSQAYWTSIMRSVEFSTASSVFWSAGPMGEAGLGNVQIHSAPGVVDLIGTQVFGVGWTVAEDALDRYLIRAIEARIQNPLVRALARSAMNPTRSYANILRFRKPWYRQTRSIWAPRARPAPRDTGPVFHARTWPENHPFELEMHSLTEQYLGKNSGGTCTGAAGEAAFQLSAAFALAVLIDGCRIDGRPQNTTDDEFTYALGPRWTGSLSKRWSHYAEFLVGGTKITRLRIDPIKRQQLTEAANREGKPEPGLDEYSTESDVNGLTMEAKSGVSYLWKEGLELRLASIGFQHSYIRQLAGYDYNEGLRFSTGVAFRLGPWRR